MQQRNDLELSRNSVCRDIDADQNAGARQHRDFRMTYLKRLSARQGQRHRLKRLAGEHLSEGLNGHMADNRTVISCKFSMRFAQSIARTTNTASSAAYLRVGLGAE